MKSWISKLARVLGVVAIAATLAGCGVNNIPTKEEQAKAELEQRLKEELGIEIAPEESLGDAATRGAQEALEEEARKALEEILKGN